jgi:hypothetical protein
MKPKTIARHAAVLVAGVALAACGNPREVSKRNFQHIVQAHLDGKTDVVCVVQGPGKIPYEEERTSSSSARLKIFDALSYAGVLKRSETEVEKTSSKGKTWTATMFSYHLTELGKQYYHEDRAGGFCFGNIRVQSVDLYTEPADAAGLRVVKVFYTYKLENIPEWAHSPALRNAEPQWAESLDGERKGKLVLVLTSAGWLPESELD